MKKSLVTLFHFLGGVRFAIFLILFTALLVAYGTYLESISNSHQYAAKLIYEHFLFSFLLSLFFINILFAALRRWPFKKKHIPFLLTHLGLLMIISGTIIKNLFGLQGNLDLWEGSGSQTLLIPHTYALALETKNSTAIYPFDLKKGLSEKWISANKPLSLRIKEYIPNSREKWESWIKGSFATIYGHPHFPVYEWNGNEPFPLPSTAYLGENQPFPIHVLALRTQHLEESVKKIYLHDLIMELTPAHPSLSKQLFPLRHLESNTFIADAFEIDVEFIDTQSLLFKYRAIDQTNPFSVITIDLEGNRSLYPIRKELSQPYFPFKIDLKRALPLLLFVEDDDLNTCVYVFDTHGRISKEKFSSTLPDKITVYDSGFGGYSVQMPLPLFPFSTGRESKELADLKPLGLAIDNAFKQNQVLIPPLEFIKNECMALNFDFKAIILEFFKSWKNSEPFLPSSASIQEKKLRQFLKAINWRNIPPSHYHGCQWILSLWDKLTISLLSGESISDVLKKQNLSLKAFKRQIANEETNLLTALANELFQIAHLLPQMPFKLENEDDSAHLLAAYFLAFGFDLTQFIPNSGKEDFERIISEKIDPFFIESPLKLSVFQAKPLIKQEDNRPAVLVEIQEGLIKEKIWLTYDSSGKGLKWPALKGKYQLKFQPQEMKIPHRIRLREARQINHPNTNQPYSYEADILALVDGKNEKELTLSMNEVYETDDGYRFYIGGMHAPDGLYPQRIQMIVNRDPIKYWITYPGAIILGIGVFLLFWFKKRFESKND